MEFVDEEDDILVFPDLIHDGLDPLLELSTVLGTRHHESQIKRDELLVGENFRDAAIDNFLGKSFGDGRLTHAGLTDKDGIVLAAAAENLNYSLDFLGATDDRIEFTLAGEFRQVTSEGFQCRCL